jgi:hypothetical protein
VADAKRRAELLAEEVLKRKCAREEMRAQLEREAEQGLKLQLQQKDFEWRQKYQVRTVNVISKGHRKANRICIRLLQ